MKSVIPDLHLPPSELQRNVPLAPYTSLRMGGPARYLWIPHSVESLSHGIKQIQSLGIPWIVLGGGSNLLISDQGFPGVVIRLGQAFSTIRNEGSHLWVGAATPFSKILQTCAAQGLAGLEFLVGVPAVVGGAIAMNFGAFGHEVRQFVHSVEVLQQDGAQRSLANSEMGWGYRKSILAREPWIVTQVELKLTASSTAAVQEKIRTIQHERRDHQPLEHLSCGCMFKNPPGSHAGELIEKSGSKGYRRGDAMVSTQHANFLVNAGSASARDAWELMQEVRQRVKDQSNVLLEPEVRFVGFEND